MYIRVAAVAPISITVKVELSCFGKTHNPMAILAIGANPAKNMQKKTKKTKTYI